MYLRQQALFNVLCAYSLYDEDVGYCQGMSEVAALLLMFMNEEVNVKIFSNNVSYNLLIHLLLIKKNCSSYIQEAFWCFAVLMTDEKHNMRGEN